MSARLAGFKTESAYAEIQDSAAAIDLARPRALRSGIDPAAAELRALVRHWETIRAAYASLPPASQRVLYRRIVARYLSTTAARGTR